MKLIRWLLSNIILIAFVLALTYAYVYWDNLTGEDTPAGKLITYLSTEYDEVREFLDEYGLAGKETGGVAETAPAQDAIETASVPQVTVPPQPQIQPVQQRPAPAQPAMLPVEQRAVPAQPMMQPAQAPSLPPQAMMQPPARQQQSARPAYPGTQQPSPSQPARQPFPVRQQLQSPPVMSQTQPMSPERRPVSQTGDQAGAAEEPATTRELWISAREEYHRGNIDGSIRIYKEVIASSTDNYDAYGELGNVYLSRGYDREAAGAYFEAASILVKTGQIGRASSLLPMLGRLDRARAEELNQLIRDATS